MFYIRSLIIIHGFSKKSSKYMSLGILFFNFRYYTESYLTVEWSLYVKYAEYMHVVEYHVIIYLMS